MPLAVQPTTARPPQTPPTHPLNQPAIRPPPPHSPPPPPPPVPPAPPPPPWPPVPPTERSALSPPPVAEKGAETLRMLCGLLGAESRGLPLRVADEVRKFLDRNLDWLVSAFPEEMSAAERRQAAVRTPASLQRRMILAVSLDDPSMLEAIVNGLRSE